MKLLILAFVVLFSGTSAAYAQLGEEDLSDLRAQVGIPAQDSVRLNRNAGLPARGPLRVFLSIKRQGNEAMYFDKWIEEWNRREGAKYGRLEVVDQLDQADVVLTQFFKKESRYAEEESIRAGVVPSGIHDAPNRTAAGTGVSRRRNQRAIKFPVYSYLIKRENALWTIIYNDVEASMPEEQFSNPELRLWQAFKREMRAR